MDRSTPTLYVSSCAEPASDATSDDDFSQISLTPFLIPVVEIRESVGWTNFSPRFEGVGC